jgi:hypothetical protein
MVDRQPCLQDGSGELVLRRELEMERLWAEMERDGREIGEAL